jgi:hypothetical protein
MIDSDKRMQDSRRVDWIGLPGSTLHQVAPCKVKPTIKETASRNETNVRTRLYHLATVRRTLVSIFSPLIPGRKNGCVGNVRTTSRIISPGCPLLLPVGDGSDSISSTILNITF